MDIEDSGIIGALENLLHRSKELDLANERCGPYDIDDEMKSYEDARRIFMKALDHHIDMRAGILVAKLLRSIKVSEG